MRGEWVQQYLGRLYDYRLRAVLAMAGIGISTASMVLVGDVLATLQANAVANLKTLGGRTLIIASNTAEVINGRPARAITLFEAQVLRRRVPGLVAVSPLVNVSDELRACGRRRVTRIIGVTSAQLMIGAPAPIDGRFITSLDLASRASVVVLGPEVSEEFECAKFVGARVTIGNHRYRVIGRLRQRSNIGTFTPNDAVYVPVSIAETRYAFAMQRGVVLMAEIASGAEIASVRGAVRRELRALHRLTQFEKDDFTIQSDTNVVDEVERTASVITLALVALLSVGVFVGTIGVLNAVLTAVIERTAEIGLRRSVGATRRSIRKQFVSEAAALSLSGGLLGALAGMIASEAFARLANVPSSHDLRVLSLAVGLSATLGIAAGVWPAVRAASIAPVDALRHE